MHQTVQGDLGMPRPLEPVQRVDPAGFEQMLEEPEPTGMECPQRGKRGDRATSAVIVALKNRDAILNRPLGDIPQDANWRVVRDLGHPVFLVAGNQLASFRQGFMYCYQ